jgi:hypothetical protein
MEWYWQAQQGLPGPQIPADLVPTMVNQAATLYYGGHVVSLVEGVALTIRDWFSEWDSLEVGQLLIQYVEKQSAILARFQSGQIKKGDGQKYVAPRLSNDYKALMHAQGLALTGKQLDTFAESCLGLTLPKDYGVGSAFGDAFADALRSATLADQNVDGWPAKEVVIGLQQPFVVALDDSIQVTGMADLVTRLADDELARHGEGSVGLEIHDYGPRPLSKGAAVRHLRVIAAVLSTSTNGQAACPWINVAKVVYRHVPTARAYTFREISPGRLAAVMAAITRGMRAQVIVPRLLTSPNECQACRYVGECTGKHWEALDLMDPTNLAQAQNLLALIRSVRQTTQTQPAAKTATLAALLQVEDEMQRVTPDVLAMQSAVVAARQTLQD